VKLIVPLVALLVAAATVPAGTLIVDINHPDAADTNPGSAEKPFKTPAGALKVVKPGDTIAIKPGVYRGSWPVRRSGTKDKPILIRGEGGMPTMTGAVLITGWKKCSAETAPDAPKPEKLFVTEIDWRPKRLFEAGRKMTCARTPDDGWWGIGKGISLTEFTSPKHLTQKNTKAWDGWTVAILEQAGGGVMHIEPAKFDPATHQITLAKPYSTYRKKINEVRDRFYMENHLSTLDGPGQYVLKKAGKGWRLYVWPSKCGDDGLPIVEAPKHGTIVEVTGLSHVIFDGLEVCFSTSHGIGVGRREASTGLTVRNCVIHHNPSYGVGLRKPDKALVKRNVIRMNGNGVVLGGSTGSIVEENDIGWNYGDGVVDAGGTRDLIIRRNYIHNHYLWGHPDNIQFWSDVRNITIEGNLMLNGGQTMMSSGNRDCTFTNNLVVGSRAVAVICASSVNWTVTNNTILSVSTPTNFQGPGITFTGNIVAPLRPIPCYSLPDDTARSDYNLLWHGPNISGTLVVKGRWKDSASTLEAIRRKLGQEAHGQVTDPKFKSIPKFYCTTDYRRVQDCTNRRVIPAPGYLKYFRVGDHVELDFDGVGRKITAVGKDYLEFDKPLAAAPITVQSVANWGDRAKVNWDVTLAKDSPARKAGKNGRTLGSDVDYKGFRAGDFDGDGKRDLPKLPETPLSGDN